MGGRGRGQAGQVRARAEARAEPGAGEKIRLVSTWALDYLGET